MKYYMESTLDKIRHAITPDKFVDTGINRSGIMSALGNNLVTIKSAFGEIFGNIRKVTKIYFYISDNSLTIWWDDG